MIQSIPKGQNQVPSMRDLRVTLRYMSQKGRKRIFATSILWWI